MDAQGADGGQAAAGWPAAEGGLAEAGCVTDRLMAAAVGTLDILAVALGERLGYYRLLARSGPLTPPGLAAASRTALRYAREWLEQQAVAGLLEVLDPGQEPDARRYRLRPGVAEVLADPDQLTYLAPLARQLADTCSGGGSRGPSREADRISGDPRDGEPKPGTPRGRRPRRCPVHP